MKLARYWSRAEGEAADEQGERIRVVARGWSDESLLAARERARQIARGVAQRLAANPGERNRYEYGDRPLPEPVVHDFREGPQSVPAVVTRNVYGSLVLNADNLMFVDVDKEEDASSATAGLEEVMSGIFSLFGKTAAPAAKSKPADSVVEGIRRVGESHNLSGRIYKTAAGYRVAVTSAPFRAGSSETETLLSEFGSDRMYMRLCRIQESFRARLTPKPWRCDCPKPPVQFPFETPQAEAQHRRWEAEYNSKIGAYATCRYLGKFGSAPIAPAFEAVVEYHDRETKASSDLPLA